MIFKSKCKSFHLFMVVFLCIFFFSSFLGVKIISKNLNNKTRRLIGGWQGKAGLLQGILPASYWSPGSQMTSSPTAMHFFIAIRIRVKTTTCFSWHLCVLHICSGQYWPLTPDPSPTLPPAPCLPASPTRWLQQVQKPTSFLLVARMSCATWAPG